MSMVDVIKAADELTVGRELAVTTGVGTHQSLVARHFTFDHPSRRFITSAGHGTMGFGVPAAVGAWVAGVELVLCFNGDGSMDMDLPHLFALARLGANVKVIVLDNARYGIVHQYERMQGLDHVATVRQEPRHYARVASSMGVDAAFCGTLPVFRSALATALKRCRPHLLHVLVSEVGVWPVLEGGSRPSKMTGEGRWTT